MATSIFNLFESLCPAEAKLLTKAQRKALREATVLDPRDVELLSDMIVAEERHQAEMRRA